MIKLIKYFFYTIYSFSLSNGEKDAGWAMTIVSIFGILNIYGILGLIQISFQIKTPQVDKWIIILLSAILLYFYYELLMKNGRAKEIVIEFKNEDKSKRPYKNLLIWLYIIANISLFIYTGNVVRSMYQ